MASNSETGHAINVSNFNSLNNSATGMGADYQPSDDALKLPALTAQHLAFKTANDAVKIPLIAYNDEVSDRALLFKPLNGLVTQLLAMFNRTKALNQEKAYAKTIADKIRGAKNKPPKVPGEDAHSTSQRSFVMRTENFDTLINILAAEPTYTPAERDLQVASLQTMKANMESLNNTTDLAAKTLKQVRTTRNTALYAEETGLVDTALAVKEYVKAAFGTKHQYYKNIKGLKFVRIADDPNA